MISSRILLPLFVVLTLLITACSRVMQPTTSDLSLVTSKYPGYTYDMLNQGKVLFESNCNRCHPYKSATSRTEAEWTEIVPRMSEKVNKKLDREELDAADQDLILKYLVTMSYAHGK